MDRAQHSDGAERFRRIVANRLGLHFDDAKLTLLGDVLRRRVDARRQSVADYLSRLEGHNSAEEIAALAAELTIHETYFFRNSAQFEALAEVVLPDRMAAQAPHRQLRLLSAGCASGEEAYSLAITAREVIDDPSWTVAIRAVDVNPAVLQRAMRARYTSWALRETRPELERTWFRPDGADFVLDASVRDAVTFQERNLSADDAELWQPGAYDVIFCRNVLMYFTPDQMQALVARLWRALSPGGYLFLGHAETLRGLSQGFHLCHTHGTFYYQRREEGETALPLHAVAAARPVAPAPAFAEIVDNSGSWVEAIHRAAERVHVLTSSSTTSAAASIAPASPRVDLAKALDLLRSERFTEALDVVDRVPPEMKRDPDVLLLQSLLLAHSGQLATAEETCRQLLAIDELSAGAHYILALCREGAGDGQGAANHDQLAAYLDPLFAMPRFHLGLLARRAGNRELARSELGQALLLLQREDASRLLFFGGGFTREALIGLCRAELDACGGRR